MSRARSAGESGLVAGSRRCPTCRANIVVPDAEGVVVRNAILRVSRPSGTVSAKCPQCKSWVEVPLKYQE